MTTLWLIIGVLTVIDVACIIGAIKQHRAAKQRSGVNDREHNQNNS